MSLQIRSRPGYDPAVGLRPVGSTYIKEMKRAQPVSSGPEEIQIAGDLPVTSLPILATANDARELVRFLKKRPNGVTVVEAMNAEPRRIFDARKIAAYEFWGIIRRENERLTLTEIGSEIAETLEPEVGMYRDILHRVPAYRIAIQAVYDESLDIATHLDVLRFWSRLRTIAGADRENAQDLEAAVVCFFSLCHAAELGTSTVGKRGQPARLRVDMDQVVAFLTNEPAPKASRSVSRNEVVTRFTPAGGGSIRKVLVSSGGIRESLEPLVSLLGLAGFESSTVNFADFENGLLPNSELVEMQQCQAGIFVIGPDDCIRQAEGAFSLRHEWITKISVAAALFDWRIVLFWNGKLPPPDELSGSGLLVLSREELDWAASLEMANHIKALAFPLSE